MRIALAAAAYFQKGVIEAELAAGEDGVLIVEI